MRPSVLPILAVLVLGTSAEHCPPEGRCLRKCCPDGKMVVRSSCQPGGPVFKVPEDFTVVYGKPDCDMYYLEPGTEHVVHPNGTVFLDGDVLEYCRDFNHLNDTYTYVCFPPEDYAIQEEEQKLKVYSIGIILSTPFFLVTGLIYACLKRLRNLHGYCIIFHTFTMFVAYTSLFLVQNNFYFHDKFCTCLGYAIQFFFMATFFWLNVMCFDIYWAFSGLKNLTGSVRERERKKLILYSCYAWGVPLLILLVTVVIDYSPYVPNDSIFKPGVGVDKCFFQKNTATGIYFYTPMGIILVTNIILFSITAIRICTLRRETAVLKRGDSRKHDSTNDKESGSDLKKQLFESPTSASRRFSDRKEVWKEPYVVTNIRFSLYLKLFLVMGINWVMELISFLAGGPGYFWYIPDFTNTLQGVFIFIIFVWKERVRRLVWAKLMSCRGCKVVSQGNRQWGNSTRNTSSMTNSSAITNNSMKTHPNGTNGTAQVENGVATTLA